MSADGIALISKLLTQRPTLTIECDGKLEACRMRIFYHLLSPAGHYDFTQAGKLLNEMLQEKIRIIQPQQYYILKQKLEASSRMQCLVRSNAASPKK